MEPFIAISTINDFLFCPRSLYMHQAAGDIAPTSYQAAPQVRGKAMHEAIDTGRYSHRKTVLQGTPIFSEKLQIQGKLDTFDTATGELIERKAHLTQVYEGYMWQLYAEYFCLREMGYDPTSLAFYSTQDNKKHPVRLPTEADKTQLKRIIQDMQTYNAEKLLAHHCPRCNHNIYAPLGW
ncbi:MAG: type V CRISPR-associated protein Cas4 [Candidatus Saccharimonadales bacterium]